MRHCASSGQLLARITQSVDVPECLSPMAFEGLPPNTQSLTGGHWSVKALLEAQQLGLSRELHWSASIAQHWLAH